MKKLADRYRELKSAARYTALITPWPVSLPVGLVGF